MTDARTTADPLLEHDRMLAMARRRLLQERTVEGHWVGELSSSALSTATGAFALHQLGRSEDAPLVARALDWLAAHQNPDGGWGDTPDSPSNLPTTLLAFAALAVAARGADLQIAAAGRAEGWIVQTVGSPQPRDIAAAVIDGYGRDRTFSAPILTMCALSGRFGPVEQAWQDVAALPFELALCPHGVLKFLRVPVVSYALPALIAIGQVRAHFAPSACPVKRSLRRRAVAPTLEKLARIQPDSGGFLEAAPLTSFVLMSLGAMGLHDTPVAGRSADFLRQTVRPDGSWPIDTNLSVWVTTLAVNALACRPGGLDEALSEAERRRLTDWLLAARHRRVHPYTQADPGGWAWTDLSGGVPDADDTPGALLALHALGVDDGRTRQAAREGIAWLLGIQNRDGGIPTFCRGWGRLDFDRSAADLTAHALLALTRWRPLLEGRLARRVDRAAAAMLRFLARRQRPDGSWLGLWFGNQHAPEQASPVYGTSRVLIALSQVPSPQADAMIARGVDWLLSVVNVRGGWGGNAGVTSSVEETAVAVDALGHVLLGGRGARGEGLAEAIRDGVDWLARRTVGGREFPAAPIGLYFARLWYSEKLYPLVMAVAALGTAREALGPAAPARSAQDVRKEQA